MLQAPFLVPPPPQKEDFILPSSCPCPPLQDSTVSCSNIASSVIICALQNWRMEHFGRCLMGLHFAEGRSELQHASHTLKAHCIAALA